LPTAGLAVPLTAPALTGVMLVSGLAVEVFAVTWMTALHQEVPEEKFSRVAAYDWLGSIAMVPLATALAGPAETVLGRSAALWSCSALIMLLTAAVRAYPGYAVSPGVRRKPTAPPRPGRLPRTRPGAGKTRWNLWTLWTRWTP
jgi:hypothetical protein